MLEALTSLFEEALHEALDALFPRACWLCGAPSFDGVACPSHALPDGPIGARCGRCAGELPRGVAAGTSCAECRRRAPAFARVVVLGDYRAEGLREWVLALKHGRRPDLARPLGAALSRRLAAAGTSPGGELVVPVPLHPLRRVERGYDQAARLARVVAETLELERFEGLRRRRPTLPQGAPGARSRRANVRDAFALPERLAGAVRGRRVWLVDDVVTSCATVDACARTLRRSGAAEVSVGALARASSGAGEDELPPGSG